MPASDLFRAVAASLQSAASGAPGRVWDELRPWMARLVVNAGPRWLPNLAMGMPCSIPIYQGGAPVSPCTSGAITVCEACSRSCCLNHARIDQFGDALCYLCVAEKVQEKRGAGAPSPGREPEPDAEHPPPDPQRPSEKDLAWARRVLGVRKDSEWDEIRTAHRQKSAKHHPDLKSTAAAKMKAEAKFKDVQRAFELLTKLHELDSEEAAA